MDVRPADELEGARAALRHTRRQLRAAQAELQSVREAIIADALPATRLVEAEAEVTAAELRFESAERWVAELEQAAVAAERAKVAAAENRRVAHRRAVLRAERVESLTRAIESGLAFDHYSGLAGAGSMDAQRKLDALVAARAAAGRSKEQGWARRFAESVVDEW